MRSTIIKIVLLATSLVAASPLAKVGSTESAPNPISQLYFGKPTGTINGTIAVIPIPFALARSIIPAKYQILTGAYQALLGSALPPNTYPLIVATGVDHDIRVGGLGLSIPDFQAAHIRFPFVDLIADGVSNFAFEKYILISNNPTAASAASVYGEIPITSTFDPLFEAYRDDGSGGIAFTAWSIPNNAALSVSFDVTESIGPYPLEFYKKITNQPTFGNGYTCDKQVTLFDTVLSTGARAPSGVFGDVMIKSPFLDGQDHVFKGVYGIKIDVAFVEYNVQSCLSLKGN